MFFKADVGQTIAENGEGHMIVKNCTLALVLLGGFAAGASESQELLEKGGVIGKIVLVSFGLTKTF